MNYNVHTRFGIRKSPYAIIDQNMSAVNRYRTLIFHSRAVSEISPECINIPKSETKSRSDRLGTRDFIRATSLVTNGDTYRESEVIEINNPVLKHFPRRVMRSLGNDKYGLSVRTASFKRLRTSLDLFFPYGLRPVPRRHLTAKSRTGGRRPVREVTALIIYGAGSGR
ncbi:hypothetical protein EVAR_97743_1 [Eumeta japonica]|uniref:Uncharacterized protein n=1 Tax=Eumeta variegata TaxID=151549 RepID=A0A4C1X646_EUMVA|nr:hypothetical protein EVAR_97743_1 [Eumeta japonica]